MLVVVAVIVGLVVVVLIALVAVGGVTGRLRVEPPRQVFEGEEAVEFVARALPDDVTAELGYEDVRRILRFHSDFLHQQGVARSGGDLVPGGGIRVVDPDAAVRYVRWRASLVDFRPREAHIRHVIEAQLAYFEAIGAVSRVAEPDLEELEAEQARDQEADPGERG